MGERKTLGKTSSGAESGAGATAQPTSSTTPQPSAKPQAKSKAARKPSSKSAKAPSGAAKKTKPAVKPAAKPKSKRAPSPKPVPAKPRASKPSAAQDEPKQLSTLKSRDDIDRLTAPWRAKGAAIALVPTMGALHKGHLALVEQAKAAAPRVIVSIFVNPTQFAPNEDLDRYPRDLKGDLAKLADLMVDAVFMPERAAMYSDDFATQIVPMGAADGLETDFRPHFFAGVATVVAKLFNQVRPDIAIFGEKDYQQLCVIRQLVRDLDLAVRIEAGATVRERDGLALSSRNAYLTPKQRSIAPMLHETLNDVAVRAKAGDDIGRIRAEATMKLVTHGFSKVDYVDVRDAKTLGIYEPAANAPGRVLAAAWLGTTRLIDNVPVA